jgi:Uma2 family endonuclease
VVGVDGPERHRFTIAEFTAVYNAGILGHEPRVELIEGDIVHMSPINPPHAYAVRWLTTQFVLRLGDRAAVSSQSAVALADDTLPQPDLALLRPRLDDYRTRHPGPADVLLVIEVSDTTLRDDRRIKGPLYARAGIAEYWIVNLVDHVLEVYRRPGPDGYDERQVVRRGAEIVPLAFPDLRVEINAVLGSPGPDDGS